MESAMAILLVGTAATLISLLIGLCIPFAISSGQRRRSKTVMAFAGGVMFWSFLDAMNDAVLLDVNQGFNGGIAQALLVGSFATGLLLLFGLERIFGSSVESFTKGKESSASISFLVAILIALGIGFHAFGEGIGIGSLATSASNVLEAIGGLRQGVAYVLHKLLEGFVIGTFAAFTSLKSARVLLLALVAGLPTVFGLLVAISMPLNSTFFFALGAGAVVYIEYKLISNLADADNMMLYAVVMLLGFFSMYLAGLFHG